MTVKEMNLKIDVAVETVNQFLEQPCTAEEMLEAQKYNLVGEFIAGQIVYLREHANESTADKQ